MKEFRISDDDIGFIATALYGRPTPSHRDDARARLYAVRENEPLPVEAPDEETGAALARLQSEVTVATRQRDLLMGQVDSLIQRLSGAHVAAGLLAMPAAQGFMQKEVFPINQVLAQIGQAEANQ